MVNQPLVKKGMGVASKEKCLYWLQNISKWIETNKSKTGTTSFVNGR
jgi:hypothetical protein